MTGFLVQSIQSAILNVYLAGGSSITNPGTLYMGLTTSGSVNQSTGVVTNEPAINTNGYARVAINVSGTGTFGTSSNGQITNSAAAITFPTATGGSWAGTLAVWFLSTSASTATAIMFGTLSSSVTVASGQAPTFATSALTLNATGW